MTFHYLCLLGSILLMVAGSTIFYAGTAGLDAWRGDAANRDLTQKEIFGSRAEHFEARREIFKLRVQRWRSAPRLRLAVYGGLFLMLGGAVCFWLR